MRGPGSFQGLVMICHGQQSLIFVSADLRTRVSGLRQKIEDQRFVGRPKEPLRWKWVRFE